MAISLYDSSVSNYLQVLEAVSGVLTKGAEYAAEKGVDLAELVDARLSGDMLPLSFQVHSVCHHSLGAITGMREGVFGPPPPLALDYAAMQKLVADTLSELQALTAEDLAALEGRAMKFKMGDFEIPFSSENFVLSFSLPNFYFHASTAYGILRMVGVPLGKLDYLGNMRAG